MMFASTVTGVAVKVAEAAANGDPLAVSSGFSPTFYAVIGSAIAGIVAVMVAYIKIKPALEAGKAESDLSLRRDLMSMMKEMETRHAEETSKIRTAHADEMAALKRHIEERDRRCEQENSALREQVKALQGMIISWQIHSGQAMPLSIPPATQKMVDKIIDAMNSSDHDRLSLIAAALEARDRHD